MRNFFHLPSLLPLITLFCVSCSQQESQLSNQSSSNQNELKIAIQDDPTSLDPRIVRDLSSASMMRLFFEGLMRTNTKGELESAIAESVSVSEDKKTYTFTLRAAKWSDGTPITAEDFEQSWKSVLSPNFPAPNAYQLYVIKGAKAAKEGSSPPDSISIKALSPSVLRVELEAPTPYFLELCSCHFYFPVSKKMREQGTAYNDKADNLIGSGPFTISHINPRNELSVVKNPNYWDVNHVKLDRITFQVLDEHTALQLFKSGAIDWAGSPLSTLPQDAIATLKKEGKLQVTAGAGTHWFRFNTEQAPFNNEKMRKAFALALDRKAIVDHVTQGNQTPAIGIIPPSFGIKEQNFYSDNDKTAAQALFNEALAEMKLTKSTLPKITLSYGANDRNHKIAQAVQQQWNKTFGIDLNLESNEGQVQSEKMKKGNYQMGMGSWYADIRDPINFLEIFESRDNPTNQTYWQNPQYAALIKKSSLEGDPVKRLAILAEAESVLIKAMPVAPLFFSAFNYLKKKEVVGAYLSPLGYIDFKEAFIADKGIPQQ